MLSESFFQLASTLLVLAASGFYAYNIMTRRIVPTKAAWLMWAIIATLVALGMYQARTLNWQAASVALADIVLFALVCMYAMEWKWSRVDYRCMSLTALAIALWQTTHNHDWAIILGLAAAFIAGLPLFDEIQKGLNVEKPLPWACMLASSICEFIGLSDWSWQSWAQPVVYGVVPFIVLLLIGKNKYEELMGY